MKLKNAEGWAAAVHANNDPYGKGVITYTERWADLMEAQMATGKSVEEVAEATSHEADTEGITGFMYGCAVALLARVWEHGEALRRWHNLATQIGHEGEAANAKGTVLNPALLTVKVNEG